MGTVVLGKVEAGNAKRGQQLLLMPNRVSATLTFLFCLHRKVCILLIFNKLCVR